VIFVCKCVYNHHPPLKYCIELVDQANFVAVVFAVVFVENGFVVLKIGKDSPGGQFLVTFPDLQSIHLCPLRVCQQGRNTFLGGGLGRTYMGWRLAAAIPAKRAAKMMANCMIARDREWVISDDSWMRKW
jgi:hypothetical protein